MNKEDLAGDHTEEAICYRLSQASKHNYLGDFVLGAVDGTVTTFAIVAGVAGSGLQGGPEIALLLGCANVLADGFSMGVSNFLKARSDHDILKRYRRMEEMHIDEIPDGERAELREIFRQKGFSEELLEEIIDVITRDRTLWVDTMLTEEWGLQLTPPDPLRSALVTFSAFIAAGMIPLMPLLLRVFQPLGTGEVFLFCSLLAAVTFFIVGAIKGYITREPALRSALETLVMGGTAALLAYVVGELLSNVLIS